MGSIDNGRRTPVVQAIRSIRDAEDVIALSNYDGIEFGAAARSGYISATSWHTPTGKRAQAMGRTRELAAQSLVRTITRR